MTGLREVVTTHLPALQTLSDAQAGRKPAPDVWSAKEILGHLIDSGVNNHARFVRAATQDGLALPGYAQNDWVSLSGWQARPWAEVLDLWRAYQLHLAQLIDGLSPEHLAHTLTVGGGGPVTLAWLTEEYVAHQLHHLAQVPGRAGV